MKPPYLVLASSSPKRKEILSSLDLNFQVDSPEVKEITQANSAHQLVKQNSKIKVMATIHKHPHSYIIGADTVVTSGKSIFFKPKNWQEGLKMLKSYRQSSNHVYTGLSVYSPKSKTIISKVQKTSFQLAPLSPKRQEQVYRMIFSNRQSGGFSIEGLGSLLLDTISGSYYNILGLPVYLLDQVFQELGSDFLKFRRAVT